MNFPGLVWNALEIALLVVFMSLPAHAMIEDLDEEEPSATVAGISPLANSRYDYDGRRDEQALEVQAALPIPVRSAEGSVTIRLPSDADSDSGHD